MNELYKGYLIKYKGNRLGVRLDRKEFKEIIDISEQTGLSLSNVALLLMAKCQKCGMQEITITKPKIKTDGSK